MEATKYWENIFPRQSSKQNEPPPNKATPENLLPPQALKMKVGWKSEYCKHHSLPHVVLLSTHDECRVCVDPRLQMYFPRVAKWQTILQGFLLQHWRTSWHKTIHPWWIGHGHHRVSQSEAWCRFYRKVYDTKNVSKGHSVVSSTATLETSMASNLQESSYLLINSRWLNVSTMHDQIIAHGYTMDGYQTHGPPKKKTDRWLWWPYLLPCSH